MTSFTNRGTCVLLVATLVGCATAPPNTPGAGSGDTYTPFVDLQGVDPQRYSSDLAGCRSYAQQIDPNKAAMQGMVAGIIIGALVGASVGGSRYHAEHAAVAGGGAGLGAAGGRAVLKQETIIANCLAGRGYRVLEGATVGTNTAAPSPYQSGPVAPVAVSGPSAFTSSTMALPATYQPSGVIQPTVAPPPVPAEQIGQDSGSVQRIARQAACHADPVAKLAAKGPGFESYTVACSNGDTWMYRCEFGNCRKLQ